MIDRIAERFSAFIPRLVLLSSLILLSFQLRLISLDSFSFWTDEGLTAYRSGYTASEILTNEIVIQDGVTRDTHPPFYYLLIHTSRRLFGETDFAFRYPSLLAGVLLVPLLYQLGRRMHGNALGVTAALLTAVNPLQVWYATEARMYTLVTLTAAAASYVLWRALATPTLQGAPLRRKLVVYSLLAMLAFYTHYVAVFLVLIQAIFWVWLLLRRGESRLVLSAVVAGLVLAIPTIPFTVPRLFTGAEAGYSYVSPLIMLKDVVHFFSLGVTIDLAHVPTTMLDLSTLGLMLAGVYAVRSGLSRSFLLAYLYATVVGLMIGSMIKPMYQGVRHIMIGSPAFMLLLAWGIVWLVSKLTTAVSSRATMVWASMTLLGIAAALVGPTISLRNKDDVRYVKSDFRSLIRYVERNAGGSDIIVYNNAILLALHGHYQQRSDLAVTASPVYPYGAAGVPAQLDVIAKEFDQIWFVTDPPADGRDSEGVALSWLDTHLVQVEEHYFPGWSTEVRVLAFATGERNFSALPGDSQPLDIVWRDLPPLRGWRPHFTQPAALPALWLDLFWQGGSPPPGSAHLRFRLLGPDGDAWLASEQPMLAKNPEPWPGDGVVRLRYHLRLPDGMPPGAYNLLLQPFESVHGSELGEPRRLASIELASSIDWPLVQLRPADSSALQFNNGLCLQEIELPSDTVRPGHNLPMTLFWSANDDRISSDRVQYVLEVVGPDGEIFRTQSATPGASWLPLWPINVLIREDTSLYFPPDSVPGRYRLRWRLSDGGAPVPSRPAWRPWRTEHNYYGEVHVIPWPIVTELPAVSTLVQADFGSTIQLYGYDLSGPTDDVLSVTLYWLSRTVPEHDYFSFVHLVSASSGEIVSQKAFVPVNGLRPTLGWRPSEVLTDGYELELDPQLPSGDYHLVAGLFDPDSGERPPVMFLGEPQPNNQLTLTTLRLP